jgi:putative transposase
VKYAFIRQHTEQFSVAALCRVLNISRSGYYEWRARLPCARVLRDRELLTHIHRVHVYAQQAYGALKTWKALNAQGVACGKHRVARLRKAAGIEARRKRRQRITVEHHKMPALVPDRLGRQFKVANPNCAWVGDVTFIRTRSGWLYLAMLLDLYSRKVVGWSMSDRNDEKLVVGALSMAIAHRRPGPGLIHHTDQGGTYRSNSYGQMLQRAGMLASMGNKGSAYDNAVAESFFSNLKNELIHHSDFVTREQAKAAIFGYIELFYNRQRIHQSLGYVSPQQFEDRGLCLD